MNERLAEIEARVEAATPGPWHLSSPHGLIYMGRWFGLIAEVDKDEDADFLAAARSDIPWLLEREKKLREALADLIQRQDRSIGQPSIRIEDWHRQALADSGEAG